MISEQYEENTPQFMRKIETLQFMHKIKGYYPLQNKFNNLDNPIKFIQNESIKNMQTMKIQKLKDFKKKRQDSAQFSRNAYKNVLSNDNEAVNFTDLKTNYEDLNELLTKMKKTDIKEEQKRKIINLEKQFVCSLYELKQEDAAEITRQPLTIEQIKLIHSPQFDQQCRNVEFYQLLTNKYRPYNKPINQQFDIINLKDLINQMADVKPKLIKQSSYYDKKSDLLMFNATDEMKLLGNTLFKDNIISRCYQFNRQCPSTIDILNVAARKVQIKDIKQFYKIKANDDLKRDKDKMDNDDWQNKYNQLRQVYDQLKAARKNDTQQMIAHASKPKKMVQTIKSLSEHPFDDFFSFDCSKIIKKLERYNIMRDMAIKEERGEARKVLLTNIHQQIKECRIQLLMIILKGQQCFNINELRFCQDKSEAQRRMLQIIYMKFHTFENNFVQNVPKVELLNIYLSERKKSQAIQQIIKQSL